MFTIVYFRDLWVNEDSVGFLKQLNLKNKNKHIGTIIPIQH